jgi:hypothetical protein
MDSAIRRLAVRANSVSVFFPRRCRKRGSHRLLDLSQHFSGGDKRGYKAVKDAEPQRQNRDKIAATAAIQRRC